MDIEDNKKYENAVRKAIQKKWITEQDWWEISLSSHKLSEQFITEFNEYLNWNFVCDKTRKFSEQFLIDNFQFIPWELVIANKDVITYNFVSCLRGQMSDAQWSDLIRMGKLDEPMLKKFRNHIQWRVVCSSMKLSEDFIREMKKYIDWYTISKNQVFTVDFMREFKEYLPFDIMYCYGKTKFSRKMQFEFLGGYYG